MKKALTVLTLLLFFCTIGFAHIDHIRIQRAIDALPSTGGKIQLIGRDYEIGGRITIPSNVTLSGVGPATRLIFDDAVDDRMIVNSDRVAGNSNIVVENLYIDGNKDGQTGLGPADGYGNAGTLDFWKVTNLVVRNCIIVNAWAAGIESIQCNFVIITGYRIDISADDGIGINDQSFFVTVSDNIISNPGLGVSSGAPCGIEVQDGSHDFSVIGNVIRTCAHDGIQVSTHAGGPLCYHGTISANVIRSIGSWGINIVGKVTEVAYDVTVTGNTVDGEVDGDDNATVGIGFGFYSKNCIAIGNIISNTRTAGILAADGDDSIIQGNLIYDNTGDGIALYLGPENILVTQNILKNNTLEDIDDDGINNIIYEQYTDLFMDVLAVSATHIRSNEDLSAGIPITFTIDAQSDIPRTLSGHFDAHANITAYIIEITGVDARGRTQVETLTEADGWDWETDNAFAIITSIIMTARTGTGAGDTMDIGITDVLGLANKIYATSDVFKIKKNTANETVAGAQVDVTYCTYDMAVIGLAATDDFTIWYRSNLNTILD